jgi:hypothetical protein
MNNRFLTALLVLLFLCVAMGTTLADPFQYTFSGTWSVRSSPNWGAADFKLILIADNGENTAAFQLYEKPDFSSVLVESGDELSGGAPLLFSPVGHFTTNGFGELLLGWNEPIFISIKTPDRASIVFSGRTIRVVNRFGYGIFVIPWNGATTSPGERLVEDEDYDSVMDTDDLCPMTATGDAVNDDGCSVAQLCPCENNWKNHGAFVSCKAHATRDFIEAGWITEEEKEEIMSTAGSSDCGHKRK